VLAKLFNSKRRANILGRLLAHPDERYFVRQLSSLVNDDATNISRELTRLEKMGILVSQSEGRQKYYQANPDCPIFDELRRLVIKTTGMRDVLAAALAPLAARVEVAFVFGSLTRGEEHRGSDVDLMVIGQVSFAEVVAVVGPAQDKLAREINPAVYPTAEFQSKVETNDHFVKNVLSGEKIFLIGGDRELAELAAKRLAD